MGLLAKFNFSEAKTGFVFMGGALSYWAHCPPLARVLPVSPAWTVASVALQGLATSAAYLGSFCLMLREAPDNEQAQGMVSSLYVMGDCTGAYLGSALGGLAYQSLGFETATYIPIGVITSSTFLFILMFGRDRIQMDVKSNSE